MIQFSSRNTTKFWSTTLSGWISWATNSHLGMMEWTSLLDGRILRHLRRKLQIKESSLSLIQFCIILELWSIIWELTHQLREKTLESYLRSSKKLPGFSIISKNTARICHHRRDHMISQLKILVSSQLFSLLNLNIAFSKKLILLVWVQRC